MPVAAISKTHVLVYDVVVSRLLNAHHLRPCGGYDTRIYVLRIYIYSTYISYMYV